MVNTKAPISDDPSIVGDAVIDLVTVNRKGGSLSAILKVPLRGDLTADEPCYGAKIEFRPGLSCVLVAGRQGRIRVVKIPNGFMLTLEEGEQEVVDPTTKAVLNLYEEMLKAGQVGLLTPAAAERRFENVIQRIDKLQQGKTSRKEPPTPK
jgi:hypothetical protein